MKFSLILVLSLAVLAAVECKNKKGGGGAASASKDKKGHGGHGCIAMIAHALDCINNNETTRDAVVAALDAAQLNQYLAVNVTPIVLNTSLVASTAFTATPLIAPVISSLLPVKPLAKINKLLINIDQLKNNQTAINHFVGVLLEHDLIGFVSGMTGSQTIDYAGLQQNAAGGELLACAIIDLGHHKSDNKSNGKGK